MIILGIDPGSNFCGYGLIQTESNKITAADCGLITLKKMTSVAEKMLFLNKKILEIINLYKPDICAIENIFYGKNIKAAFLMGHFRGVILFTLYSQNLLVSEYSPREIKKAVSGNGGADKEQVQFMVKKTLGLGNIKSYDESDALAVALCHHYKIKFKNGEI